MGCYRCPHQVRHGFLNKDGQIEFTQLCSLKVRRADHKDLDKAQPGRKATSGKKTQLLRKPKVYSQKERCEQYPFSDDFQYFTCPVYIATFKTTIDKKDVVPTKDFEFTEIIATAPSLTDMELL